MARSGRSLEAWVEELPKCPQVLINVRVQGDAKQMLARPEIAAAVQNTEQSLAGRGRVLLRPSGTEPLIRVMVEAQDAGETQQYAEQLADVVRALA